MARLIETYDMELNHVNNYNCRLKESYNGVVAQLSQK